MRILTVLGTRPEAIKLAPVIRELAGRPGVAHALCVTGQHRQMLDQVLGIFGLVPDHDLAIMKPDQDLTHITTAVLERLGALLEAQRPDWVIVQGDTTTAFAAALAAFYRRVRVAHVEAGLRTGDLHAPWPEEMNRQAIARIASVHFAPTAMAAENLRREGVPERAVLVTGNTVVDALHWVCARPNGARGPDWLDPARRLILVTGHRRDTLEGGLEQVCRGLVALAGRGDVQIVYPVHLNPRVRDVATRLLGDVPGIHLIPPQDYPSFVALMRRAALIVTDSGGIQEEAPGLGVPVLVTRPTTERPEAIEAGAAELVGTDADALVAAAGRILDAPLGGGAASGRPNPFGDGHAARRIVDRLLAEAG